MCTLVLLRRPAHAWPLIVAANRDEMADRLWTPPGRHWPDRPEVIAGLDRQAGGTWLGLNEDGVVAGVLNRMGSLGPEAGKRSRGELPLEALDHAEARAAADALADLNAAAYRSFNLVVADFREAFWVRSDDRAQTVDVTPVPEGVSMVTAHDMNDSTNSPRIRRNLGRFRAAPAPDPERNEWMAWETLLADRGSGAGNEDGADAMTVVGESGFGTVCSSVLAVPDPTREQRREPVWRFCPGRPGDAAFHPVILS